ncbi:MAG TPA: sugar phosphate isomerase/epimerase, partial [Gemmatales bacterium]|nr:sugar phosphate isomerase/epimerase [Gemmatales bacterium]
MLLLASMLIGLAVVEPPDLFCRDNLVAWCIVPFDARQRGPAERVAMLKRLGISRYAYDWREKHLPSFQQEVQLCKREGIRLQAVWFPASLNQDAQRILDVLQREQIKTELWVMPSEPGSGTDTEKLEAVAKSLEPVLEAARNAGCTVALYNHGGWIGEPERVLQLIAKLADSEVGVVYNLHHGHAHLERLPEVFQMLKPHLKCVTLNGM